MHGTRLQVLLPSKFGAVTVRSALGVGDDADQERSRSLALSPAAFTSANDDVLQRAVADRPNEHVAVEQVTVGDVQQRGVLHPLVDAPGVCEREPVVLERLR
jgi:hypothetical protein